MAAPAAITIIARAEADVARVVANAPIKAASPSSR